MPNLKYLFNQLKNNKPTEILIADCLSVSMPYNNFFKGRLSHLPCENIK